MGLIYKATSKTSGKSYIGLTSRTLDLMLKGLIFTGLLNIRHGNT
jgi:hypothetical protein